MSFEWDERLAAWRDELELLAKIDDTPWVPLATAEGEAGSLPFGAAQPGIAMVRSHLDWSTARTGRNGWYHFRPCWIAPGSQLEFSAALSTRSASRHS